MKSVVKPEEKIANLIKPYSGQWVTISADKKEVLGHSFKMETALNQATRKGEVQPLLVKSPDSNTAANIF